MSVVAFRRDRGYLLRYFALNIVLFGAAATLIALTVGVNLRLHLGPIWLAVVPLGALFGLVTATAFHNASHGNIGPAWLSFLVGETIGAYNLEGMRAFKVGHQLHHGYADDPEKDPHPPAGKTFLQFLLSSRDRTIECLSIEYLLRFGVTPRSARNIRWQVRTFKISVGVKLIFWFVVMGPGGFMFFFVPSYLAYFLGFGHLNYISHLPDADGVVRIKNHDHNLFFKIMNVITSGGYFHKSHHRFPCYYNPGKAERHRGEFVDRVDGRNSIAARGH